MFVKYSSRLLTLFILVILPAIITGATAKNRDGSLILDRVFSYRKTISDTDSTSVGVYVRYHITVDKRNPTLLIIPTMYALARGNKEYAGETYSTINIKDGNIAEPKLHVSVGTIPHHRKTMSVINFFLTPSLYEPTLIGNNILSPFNRINKSLYKYKITPLTNNRSEILFLPKLRNTQMISGTAITDNSTGRIISIYFSGEHDMISFKVRAVMGDDGLKSLIPLSCDVEAVFNFLGNKITTGQHAMTIPHATQADMVTDSHDRALMDSLRPEKLPSIETYIYNRYDSIHNISDSVKVSGKKKNDIIWDDVCEYLINRIKGNFGTSDRGSFRISPVLNPLYLGYSNNKGLTYKMKIRGNYIFSQNRDISLYLKAGYSFKQHQLYFKLPITYTFNKRHNGYAVVEIGNGNRITNSSIVDRIKHESLSDIDWDNMHLDYFKDFYTKFLTNYDLSSKLSMQPGIMFHRRSAVDKKGFGLAGKPVTYHSFSPTLQIQIRPWGRNGVYLTTDYERGIKGIGQSTMDYERFEFDASWIKRYYSIRALSLRAGLGFYTSKGKEAYFLDYTNFYDENIPGGWNDDWTGEFQLLNSNWYNASEYYVRTNTTYETPMMFLSRLPLVGKVIETERFYINTLFVKHLHPYIEYGYGFTNRLFSVGVFAATRNHKFDGVGCRFGFELFKDW